jgi:hypothetical protein
MPESETGFSSKRTTLSICEDCQQANRLLRERPGTHLLLLFQNPAKLIATALRRKLDPAKAIAKWRDDADELLAIYRQSRRRITLLEKNAACSAPDLMIDALNKRLGLALEIRSSATQSQSAPDLDLIYLIIAERMLEGDVRARSTLNELQASAIPLEHAFFPRQANPSAALQEYQEIRVSLAQQQTANSRLKEHVTALEKRIHEFESGTTLQTELKEENNLILAQLHQVQEALESYFLENKDLKSKLKSSDQEKRKFERKARQATNMLKDVHASFSWKITAPIRLLLKPFLGK